jgi:hypothetical protein
MEKYYGNRLLKLAENVNQNGAQITFATCIRKSFGEAGKGQKIRTARFW